MKLQQIELRSILLSKGFWQEKTRLVAEEMLPYQWKALNDKIPGAEPSHALQNFRIAAGESSGDFAGTIWQDSDVAKWLEAACYSLVSHPDPELESQVEETIRLIGKVQQKDGYINTWFTIRSPEKRWTDLVWGHELYCGGHLIEAAVAHFQTTGKRHFLDIMMRYADGLIPVFGAGGIHESETCGHPEIELALMRLFEASGEERYFELARHFLDMRGKRPNQFIGKKPLGFIIPETRWFAPDYFLAHAPVKDQKNAEGHAVRAMYLYTAMAHEYRRTGNADLKAAMERLWESTVGRRMYLTGSLGSQAHAERFTVDWDLPSDTAYAETCASIGLIFWAWQLSLAEGDSRYADIIERVLYNGALSGMSLDGQKFFYVNPLETLPRIADARNDLEHVKTKRVAWFGCSCCPPNIARLVASVGQLAYSADGNGLWVHQYISTEAQVKLDSGFVTVSQKSGFPWNGKISLTLSPQGIGSFALYLQIPEWAKKFSCTVNGEDVSGNPRSLGYLRIEREWMADDDVELEFEMAVRYMLPNSNVSELNGRMAITRGPLVYCAEETDNGAGLYRLMIDPSSETIIREDTNLMGGTVQIILFGHIDNAGSNSLYTEWSKEMENIPKQIILVPYHQWGNRKPGQEMRVWLRRWDGGNT